MFADVPSNTVAQSVPTHRHVAEQTRICAHFRFGLGTSLGTRHSGESHCRSGTHAKLLEGVPHDVPTNPSAHRCGTDQNSATGGQRWPVHHAAAVETRPGGMSTATRAARLVPDEHGARPEAMTVRTGQRWPRHPRAIGAADQLADCGHSDRFTPNSGFLLGLLRSCCRGLRVGSRSAVVADTSVSLRS
jgi:hypothetical protein